MADRDYEKLAAQYRKEAQEMKSGEGKVPSKESQQAAADAAQAAKEAKAPTTATTMGKKKGGCVKKYARGGGIEIRGKTKGKMV